MLTKEQLTTLLSDIESDQVERTISTTNIDKFCEAVCAFANDMPNHRQPGYLLIGAKDDGTLSGLTVTDQLLQNLAAIRSDGNVLPQPHLNVAKFSLNGGDIAVVEVSPADMPPVRYKGRVYIRVGPRRAIANAQEERALSERRTLLISTFDLQSVREATLLDLSHSLFSDYRASTISSEIIEANHRTLEEQLAALRCFDLSRNTPTVAGILLFGKNPRFFLPGAYVQFLRFPGTSMADTPIDQLEIVGDLRTILETIRLKIQANNTTGIEQGEGFRDKLLPDYPEWALRELFHNAVMHRDYASTAPIRFYWFSKHIEIQNSGGLFGSVTRETLTRRNDYRNPVLAEAMKVMSYVNKYGHGIQRAEKLLKDNGNPPLEFDTDDKIFGVTIRKKHL